MSGPIAPIWFVFPLAGVAMVITAAYLIALREAPAAAMPDSRRRLRTGATWLLMVMLPLTAYGFGIANTNAPKVFMLVWVTITVLLAFIFMFAIIDLMMLSAQQRQLRRSHREAVRAAQRDMVRLASGVRIPGTSTNQGQGHRAEDPSGTDAWEQHDDN